MPNRQTAFDRIAAAMKFVIKATLFTVAVFVVLLIAFHARIIDAIYKNVDDLNDGEMPPTVTSYPSGPEVVSIIGGSACPRGLTFSSTAARTRTNVATWFANGSGKPVSPMTYAIAMDWRLTATHRTTATASCRTKLSACANTFLIRAKVPIQSDVSRIRK